MRSLRLVTVLTLLAAPVFAAGQSKTYVGVITDTMCGMDHKAMKAGPDPDCIRLCAKHGSKYALSDGKHVYTLSDQQTPAAYAGAPVKVTGVLYEKTNVLAVDRIERQ